MHHTRHPSSRILHSAFCIALALAAASARADWLYDTGVKTLTEQGVAEGATAWVLNCSVSTTNLTVTSVKTVGTATDIDLRTTITATDNGTYAITAIGGSAFKEKSTIVSVSLPDTVTTIGGDAFRGMGGLTSVRLSANLQSIGNCAFFGDSRLTSVTPLLPDTLTSLVGYTFHGCPIQGNLVISNPAFSSLEGSNPYGTFMGSRFTRVDLSGTSLTALNGNTFRGNSSLREIILPPTITAIGSCPFYGYSAITNIVLASCPTFDGQAFNGANSGYGARIAVAARAVQDWMAFLESGSSSVYGFQKYADMDAATQAKYAFSDDYVPYGYVRLGTNGPRYYWIAFEPATTVNLQITTSPADASLLAAVSPVHDGGEVELPFVSSVPATVAGTSRLARPIGYALDKYDTATDTWTSLSSLTAGTSFTLPSDTGSGLYRLTWHFEDVGYTLATICDAAFGTITADAPDYEGGYYAVGRRVNVTFVPGGGSFKRWRGDVAEESCFNPSATVTMDAAKTVSVVCKWKHFASENVLFNGDWKLACTRSGDNVSVTGVRQVGEDSLLDLTDKDPSETFRIVSIQGFYGRGEIEEVRLPDTVTAIGTNGFREMGNLKTVRLSANLESLGFCCFFGNSKLATVTPLLPFTVTNIMGSAFYNCSSLVGDLILENRNLSALPENEQYGTFYGCQFASIDLSGSSIRTIPTNGFRGDGKLKRLLLPKTLTAVNHCAFYSSCGALEEVRFDGPPVSVNNETFSGWSSLKTRIAVPANDAAWETYVTEHCAPVELTAAEREDYAAKFPGTRRPRLKIKFGGYGAYEYLCPWSKGGTVIFLQ